MSEVVDEIERWLQSIRGVTCFTEKLKVYAPTCYGQCLDAVEKLISRINQLFGGSTVYDAEGTWVSGTKVEREPVKVIEVGHRCADVPTAKAFTTASFRSSVVSSVGTQAHFSGSVNRPIP